MNCIRSEKDVHKAGQVVCTVLNISVLPDMAVVHHINGDQRNYKNNNLVLCNNRS